MNRITFACAFALAIIPSVGLAQVLNVDVDEGRVTVAMEGNALSERALEAIRMRAQARLGRSPLREHGKLHVALRGQALTELGASLQDTRLGDEKALDQAIDRILEAHLMGSNARSLAKPVDVIIGRHFELGVDSWTGSVVAIGASGRIDASVADVIAIGSHIELGPRAEVSDRFIRVGSHVEQDPDARVTGQEVSLWLPQLEDWGSAQASQQQGASAAPSSSTRLLWSLFGLLASFGLGSLGLRATPVFSAQVSSRMRQGPGKAFGVGLLHVLATVPVALLLVLTVLGVALLPLYGLALGFLIWAGHVAGAALIGALLFRSGRSSQQLLLGLVLLTAASWVPVLGGIVGFFVMATGVGAIMSTTYARIRARRDQPPRAATPSGASVISETATQQG